MEYTNIRKRENSPITIIREKSGYTCPQMGKGCIGDTIKETKETKETIDHLINEVIRCCNTTESKAIKLIKENKTE